MTDPNANHKLPETPTRPGGQIDYFFINAAVDLFLITHRNGVGQLLKLIASVPGDRTEAEFEAEGRDRGKAAAKRAYQATLAEREAS